MTREPERVLFASDNLRATLKPAGGLSRPLVVTFAPLEARLDLDRPGFGEAWARDAGYDAVHVVSAENSWYQFPEMPELFAAVRQRASQHPHAVAYGSSMGGYAAVRFAGRVGARTAIALSPQFSIDPARAPFDARWRRWSEDVQFRWEDPEPQDAALTTAWVVYDPHDPDRLHADALARRRPVRPLPVRHAGHPAGVYLAEAGLLSRAVVDMIEDRFEPDRFLAEARTRRRQTGKYFETLALRNRARRPRLALSLAAQAVQQIPHSAAYALLHALTACQAGALEDADALVRRAIELGEDHPLLKVQLAEALFAGGRNKAALRWARATQDVEHSPAQRRLSDLFFKLGEDRAALTAAIAARRLAPGASWGRARTLGLLVLLACPPLGKLVLDWVRRDILKVDSPRLRARMIVKSEGST